MKAGSRATSQYQLSRRNFILPPPSAFAPAARELWRAPSSARRPAASRGWWSGRESNPRPSHCERDALPTELPPQFPQKRAETTCLAQTWQEGCRGRRQFSVWPLPPEGGTTNGRKPGEKPFVVHASAGPKNPLRAILRIAAGQADRMLHDLALTGSYNSPLQPGADPVLWGGVTRT